VNVEMDFGLQVKSYTCIAIGAQYATKRMPLNKLQEIIRQLELPIVLIGGPSDVDFANQILKSFPDKQIISTCGNFSLAQSASIVKQSASLLTNDTGMMHIATCFMIQIISIWGNTVPAFGMYPYYPKNKELYSIHQVSGLSCRPCSKIGFQECPKGHFKCMNEQNSIEIVQRIQSIL
jgi:ADP-heptose:LPS heptosyltransferase